MLSPCLDAWLDQGQRQQLSAVSTLCCALPHPCRRTQLPEEVREELLADLSERFTPGGWSPAPVQRCPCCMLQCSSHLACMACARACAPSLPVLAESYCLWSNNW